MATDAPYGLDFFQKITDCQFGSNWFGVVGPRISDSGGGNVSFAVDFPGEAGGTPGYKPVISNGNIGPIDFADYVRPPTTPQRIFASDLKRKIRTDAGAEFNCFAIGQVDAFGSAMMLFNMADFPATTFPVRIRLTGVATTQNVGIFCLKRNKMKAGLTFVSSFDLPLQDDGLYPNVGEISNFRVNPVTLKVTQI